MRARLPLLLLLSARAVAFNNTLCWVTTNGAQVAFNDPQDCDGAAVLWGTSGESDLSALPTWLLSSESFKVHYRAEVPQRLTGYQPILEMDHANLHSCPPTDGFFFFCDPLAGDFGTSTPELKGNFSLDGTPGANGSVFRINVTSELQLEPGMYTVIAHVRWFDENNTQHDMARAALTDVRPPRPSMSWQHITLITISAVVPCSLGFFGLRYCLRSYLRARRAETAALRQREAHVRALCDMSNIQRLGFPLCCITFETFRKAGKLITHEHARLHSLLTWYDTVEQVKEAIGTRTVIFLSHQWKARSEPDPNRDDWKAAVLAVERLAATHGFRLEETDIWIDYTSIPQSNKASQLMSIESLPVYAAFSRFFIVVAPSVTAGGDVYNHGTYSKRGWCRLEQWARITQCGVDGMYVCHGAGAEEPLVSFSANATVLSEAADVMGGNFTVDTDRVKLVDVMVQLYHQLLMLPEHVNEESQLYVEGLHERSNRIHFKARTKHPAYPPRFKVSDDKVNWQVSWPEYKPTAFTHAAVHANNRLVVPGGWADPPDCALLKDEWSQRLSFEPEWKFDPEGRPLNPHGRTGMCERGLLGKWGANQAADPIVTRRHPVSGRLQMVAIQRKDTGDWAIPGGMVDAGEVVSATVRREFIEECGAIEDEAGRRAFSDMVDVLFASGQVVYRGYVDDPRNTDNAWMETTVFHFHLGAALGSRLALSAGDDAAAVRWLNVDPDDKDYSNLYASHKQWVDKVADGHVNAIDFLRSYVQGNRDRLFPKELFGDYIQLGEREALAAGRISRSRSSKTIFQLHRLGTKGKKGLTYPAESAASSKAPGASDALDAAFGAFWYTSRSDDSSSSGPTAAGAQASSHRTSRNTSKETPAPTWDRAALARKPVAEQTAEEATLQSAALGSARAGLQLCAGASCRQLLAERAEPEGAAPSSVGAGGSNEFVKNLKADLASKSEDNSRTKLSLDHHQKRRKYGHDDVVRDSGLLKDGDFPDAPPISNRSCFL